MYSSGLSVSALENGEMNGNRALGLSPEICWGADKSLARPGKKQARNNAMGARDFKNIETRAVIKFFFSARQDAEENSRHYFRNVTLFPFWSG